MTRNQAIGRLIRVQRALATHDELLQERNRLMVELHQEHLVRQSDIALILAQASTDNPAAALSESGVGAAIRKTLGHRAGRVANLAARARIAP
jgi:hypothetical protein